jgi:hypothetical protein
MAASDSGEGSFDPSEEPKSKRAIKPKRTASKSIPSDSVVIAKTERQSLPLEQLQSRHRIEEDDAAQKRSEANKAADHERTKDIFICRSVTILLCVAFGLGFVVAVIPAVPDDSRRWAAGLVTMIVSGGAGFMFGKSVKSS